MAEVPSYGRMWSPDITMDARINKDGKDADVVRQTSYITFKYHIVSSSNVYVIILLEVG